MEEIALASAAIALVEKLIPKIQEWVKSGQVSPEEQKALFDKYNNLATSLDEMFNGDEWKIE